MKNHIRENTIILSLLNGTTGERLIRKAYGEDKVLYSVAQGMDAVREGNKLTKEGKNVFRKTQINISNTDINDKDLFEFRNEEFLNTLIHNILRV
nr:2-dehydropantoate 2-reductase N-terminal domain-containing protein [Clostridium sp. UBA1652]